MLPHKSSLPEHELRELGGFKVGDSVIYLPPYDWPYEGVVTKIIGKNIFVRFKLGKCFDVACRPEVLTHRGNK